ncbi:MAG: heat-inducible transcription repressor HrcA [Peptococcaceae bacterium]|nr:heat-inducible transcription repressor HrcA [Peptococcaceae bacterium]
MDLDERKKKILRAIVQDFIMTAEPVGSRTIARKYNFGVSPATIRNEMADLEEMGYLEQPHTSSGRIPSNQGYRYYVDHLMEPASLDEAEKQLIRVSYRDKVKEISEVIRNTGKLLAQLTNYAALVVTPHIDRNIVRFIQLIPLHKGQAIVLVVMEPGAVYHKIMDLPENITACDLETISKVFNAKIQGHQMSEIKLTLIREIYLELLRYKYLVQSIMELIDESSDAKEEKIYLGGVFNMLNQPEFHNIERVKTLLSLLEQEALLRELLETGEDDKGVTVRIGKELKHADMQDCSVVSARYQLYGDPLGTIAVLGPTRMQYDKVVSVVEYLTNNLSRILDELYGPRSGK